MQHFDVILIVISYQYGVNVIHNQCPKIDEMNFFNSNVKVINLPR